MDNTGPGFVVPVCVEPGVFCDTGQVTVIVMSWCCSSSARFAGIIRLCVTSPSSACVCIVTPGRYDGLLLPLRHASEPFADSAPRGREERTRAGAQPPAVMPRCYTVTCHPGSRLGADSVIDSISMSASSPGPGMVISLLPKVSRWMTTVVVYLVGSDYH